MAVVGNASAGSNSPTVGSPPQSGDNSAPESATDLPTGADAYNRAAVTDPYNQPDFSAQQSFGLTASQMLGAAAACEQLHSDLVSGKRAASAPKDPSNDDRADIDAAQQHLLDPAATAPNALNAGEVDCDRVSGSFSQLQQIQIRDQDLAKALDQPDAMSPTDNAKGGNGSLMSQTLINQASRQGQQRH
jgi:hypothetical protein